MLVLYTYIAPRIAKITRQKEVEKGTQVMVLNTTDTFRLVKELIHCDNNMLLLLNKCILVICENAIEGFIREQNVLRRDLTWKK